MGSERQVTKNRTSGVCFPVTSRIALHDGQVGFSAFFVLRDPSSDVPNVITRKGLITFSVYIVLDVIRILPSVRYAVSYAS